MLPMTAKKAIRSASVIFAIARRSCSERSTLTLSHFSRRDGDTEFILRHCTTKKAAPRSGGELTDVELPGHGALPIAGKASAADRKQQHAAIPAHTRMSMSRFM